MREELSVQIACLESRLQQVAEEWNRLGHWLAADWELLASVRAHSEQVQTLLAATSQMDQETRNALAELAVIGYVQGFLLEQSIQQEARERRRLEQESDAVQQMSAALYQHSGSKDGA